MAVLNKLTGTTKIWRWGPTEQRAFEKVKDLVEEYRGKTRVPLSYAPNAPRLWLVTDASMTGAAGHLCQGEDWKTAKPVAFWSGKFTSAEQAYRTHEQELLAIVSSLKRFRHHLLGAKFTIVTDHERLESLHTQKDLNRRQLRWMETLSDFDFDVLWVEGKSNVFADALSRIYSNDAPGVERAASEYVNNLVDEYEEDSNIGLFNVEPTAQPSRLIIVGEEVEKEMEIFMAQPAKVRHNVPRNKGRMSNLAESESDSSGEDEASNVPTPVVKPKRGRGRPRKSVPVTAEEPKELRTGETKSVAPSSGRNEPPTSTRAPEELDEDGESEIDASENLEVHRPSKRMEYQKMVARKREAKNLPEFDVLTSDESNDDGESEIDVPEGIKERESSRKAEYQRMITRKKQARSPARRNNSPLDDSDNEGESKTESSVNERRKSRARELLEADRDMDEERLPPAREDSGSLEPGVRLTDVIKEVEFPHDLEGRYGEDPFFAMVLENPSHYANFEVKGNPGKELIFIRDSNQRTLCIPDVSIGSRKAREIVITHAHSILAHLGTRKTLWYLRDNVWWKEMVKDIADYCASCEVCARTKPTNQKPAGLLHPLKVPTRPWEQIGVDFVGPLPESKNRYGAFDQVMVIIDHLTSMTHLIPTKINYRARQIAEIFYDTVYKLHGLPERIVSDRDKIFTSIFWKNLHRLMRVDLKMSSTYHPQTDGATERANRTMVQMVRNAVGDTDTRWLERLPAIEWAMNAARSETTGFSPFFLNYGYRPRPLLWSNSSKEEYPGVHAFAQKMKDAIMKAHDAILEKRVKQIRLANKSRRPAKFVEGDRVYLSTRNLKLPKGKTRKLVPKFIGPYEIKKALVPGTTYQLELPAELKARGVHNAFHAELLRPFVPNCDTRFPGRQFSQLAAFGTKDEEWEVARIASHSGAGPEVLFKVDWTNGDSTWEPAYRVKELEALTEYLEAMGVTKITQLPSGSGVPPPDDPETFIGALMVVREDPDEHKRDATSAPESPSPTSPSPSPSAFASPHTHFEPSSTNMSRANRRYITFQDERSVFNVTRTRNGTPYPQTKPKYLAPPAVIKCRPDPIKAAVEVALAGTTVQIGREIRRKVARLTNTPKMRDQLMDKIREQPGRFFQHIGMPDILERTVESLERNAAGPTQNGGPSANPANPTNPSPTATFLNDNVESIIRILEHLSIMVGSNNAVVQQLLEQMPPPAVHAAMMAENAASSDLAAFIQAMGQTDTIMADESDPILPTADDFEVIEANIVETSTQDSTVNDTAAELVPSE